MYSTVILIESAILLLLSSSIWCKYISLPDLNRKADNGVIQGETNSRKENLIDFLNERLVNPGRLGRKECAVDDDLKQDCGYYGIRKSKCYERECCWGRTRTPGVPWCYYSKKTVSKKCNMHTEERMECGYYGITKDQCLQKSCCWQPTNQNGIPWCFHEKKPPIQVGECGNPAISPLVGGRIVGGVKARPHSWPWQVSVQVESGHHCGGSIINKNWIVTAAHCKVWYASLIRIVAGINNLQEQIFSRQEIEFEEPILHENFDIGTYDNDIMLLKLKTPLAFSDEVSPVCLPEAGEEFEPGLKCYTSGWGHSKEWGTLSDDLQQVMVPVIDSNNCNKEDWYEGKVTDNMLCAGYEEGGQDSCQADSGGPLVCLHDDKWKLVGVVSWGEGCARERKPGVYAKTSRFINWINQKIYNGQ